MNLVEKLKVNEICLTRKWKNSREKNLIFEKKHTQKKTNKNSPLIYKHGKIYERIQNVNIVFSREKTLDKRKDEDTINF